jgi:hypothetical protein
MYASRLFAMTLAVVFLLTLDVGAYTYGGAPLFVTVAIASTMALVAWIGTTYRRPASRPAALDLHIATVVALLVLYSEQWYRGFSSRLMQLYPAAYPAGVGITDHAFVAVFPLAGSALLLLGALAYYHGAAFGRFAAWFTFAWGAIAALAVYVYPLFGRDGTCVMPGAFTAPLPFVISVLGMRALTRSEGRTAPTSDARRNHRAVEGISRLARRTAP